MREINLVARRFQFTWIAVVALILSVLLAARFAVAGVIACTVSVIGIGFVHRADQRRRTFHLHYDFEATARTAFDGHKKILQLLGTAQRLWVIDSAQSTWDWKRNAGASHLITRHRAFAGNVRPPHIATNVDVLGIASPNFQAIFLPDRLLIFRAGVYVAIEYNALQVGAGDTRYIEDEWVANDAQVVGQTWKFVNKNGGPDRRFNNNRQIPVCRYGVLEISAGPAFKQQVHVSSSAVARQFANALYALRRHRMGSASSYESSVPNQGHEQAARRAAGQSSREVGSGRERSRKTAYEVLGVSAGASLSDIVQAYRRLAKMYHPDVVANLAPAFRDIADTLMKEINAAYRELKMKVG